MSGSIVVVGSVALDSVKTLEGESKEALGGSAVYFSLAARNFNPVSVVGVVGKDFPAEHREMLTERGIDLSGLKVMPGKTFRWVGKFGRDLSDAKTLATHLNVFKDFKPVLTAEQRRAPVVFLANIDPELQAEVLAQMQSPAVVACDTMNYWISSKPEALKELLGKVQIFFANEEEAKKLTRQPNALRAANTICEWGPSVVVIKEGEHGAVLKVGRKFYVFPAFPLETVKDPTGAGDTFAGGFMGYLAACRGFDDVESLKRAMLYGTVTASFTVEDFSTRSIEGLSRGRLDERFEDFLDRLSVSRGAAVAA
ncbi:MAG: sugar kinase [Elusimicrobia bacterium]|nr:sugar kinase [Elusimicrobiota bacterium]